MTLSKRIVIDCELADERVFGDLIMALEIITGYMSDNVVIGSTEHPDRIKKNVQLIDEYKDPATPVDRKVEIAVEVFGISREAVEAALKPNV